jgi:hypothetical protein
VLLLSTSLLEAVLVNSRESSAGRHSSCANKHERCSAHLQLRTWS